VSGQLSYQLQSAKMAAKVQSGSASKYNQTLGWFNAGAGGPGDQEQAVLSTARTTARSGKRDNRANFYGELPDYQSTRNEGFGKLTFTPLSSVLLNASYRYSHRLDKSDLFGQASASTTGTGYESRQRILTADGSWVLNSRSFASFKFTHFENPNVGRPGQQGRHQREHGDRHPLDLANLDKIALLTVPSPLAGQDAANAFFQQYIDRYGYSLERREDRWRPRRLRHPCSTTTTSSARRGRSHTT